MKTRTVKHPTMPNVSQDVPGDRVDEWIEQGWVVTDSLEPEEETTPDPEVDEPVGTGQITPPEFGYRPVDL